MKQQHLAPVGLALAVAAWLGFSLGVRPLALPDEGRYVGVAWEMLRSNDWFVPTLDGLPFFHKPPLFYWLTAAALKAFGTVDWAARTASYAGAGLAVLSIYLLLRHWLGQRAAVWTTVVLVTQPFFFGGAQFANLDMLVAGCITATIALGAHAVLCLEAGREHRRALVAAHATAALGVLAKGLIGVVLPAGVLVVWLLVLRRARLLPRLLSASGWLVFLLIAAPWFIAMELRHHGFLDYFFVHQHWHRYTLGTFNNTQPFWFLPASIAVLTLPWFPGVWAAWRARATPREGAHAMLGVLMPVWFAVIVVFFSIPRSKLVGYALPALPPLAAMIACGVWQMSHDGARTARRLGAVAALAALVCAGGTLAYRLIDTRSTESLARLFGEQGRTGDAVVFVGAYYYDVPFHARLREPVPVIEAWTAPDIASRDNWRKELFDASRFAPERAGVLVDRADLNRTLCNRPVSWVFAPADAADSYLALRAVPPLARTRRAALWRIERSVACTDEDVAPSAGLAAR